MVRAIEGLTVTKDEIENLECGVCGEKLNLKADKLHEAVDHCGIRYGVSTGTPVEPPLRVDAIKLPDSFTQNQEQDVKKEAQKAQTKVADEDTNTSKSTSKSERKK